MYPRHPFPRQIQLQKTRIEYRRHPRRIRHPCPSPFRHLDWTSCNVGCDCRCPLPLRQPECHPFCLVQSGMEPTDWVYSNDSSLGHWMWGKIKPNGMVFAVFLVLYSVGRFWTMFYREQNEYAFDLVQAQMISVIVLIVILPVLISKARFVGPISGNIGGVFKGTRAERRRRER